MIRPVKGTCASYHAGHQVHWIQWKLSLRSGYTRSEARVEEINGDGSFVLITHERRVRCWNHDPGRLRELVETYGARVDVVPELHALVLHGYWVNYTTSFDTACQPLRADW